MKTALVQISDIHISRSNDFIISRVKHFVAATKDVINECQRVVFVLAGDIVNTGQKVEYEFAQKFFQDIEEGLKKEAAQIEAFDYIIVPGNHDCYLPETEEKTIREGIISLCKNNDVIDNSEYIKLFMDVQSDFWNFYSDMTNDSDVPFVSKQKVINLSEELSLEFHLYNSSLLSLRKEIVGSLIIPENYFLTSTDFKQNKIIISVFHHNTGWLCPNTNNNNKKQFETHLFNNSNIIICGHEHEQETKTLSEFTGNSEVLYFEGGAFQYGKKSEFNILVIDSEKLDITCYNFNYQHYENNPSLNHYTPVSLPSKSIKAKNHKFVLNKSFQDELNRMNIPIKLSNKPDLNLTDIYVYPDLEPILNSIDVYAQYVDASELTLESINMRTIFIEGEAQSGKSSLLNMIFLASYKRGMYPILIKGKEIDSEHTANILEKKFKRQYDIDTMPYELYKQQPKESKMLIIDNFDDCILNNETRKNVLQKLELHYGTIIISLKETLDIRTLAYSGKSGEFVKQYKILSFGSVKRNELIEKWVRLQADPQLTDQRYIEREVKVLFDQMTNLLGEQFITPYPVFLLSLLQSLSKTFEPFQIEQTYYAYCYNSLILFSIQSTGVDADTQKEYMNFLTELAYYMYDSDRKKIKYKELDDFINKYKTKYLYKSSLDKTLKDFCDANILRVEDEIVYMFSYKYIFYYLVAQKLSTFVTKKEGQEKVQSLCLEMHKEESANILIFLVYHSKNNDMIETLLLASMMPFDKYEPITLSDDDGFIKKISEQLSNIKNNVLITDINPAEERKRALKDSDEIQRRTQRIKSLEEEQTELEEIERNQDIKDIIQTFRAIRILGQIVKNQKSDIDLSNLIDILTQAYLTCFRMVSFYSHYLENIEDDLINEVIENHKNNPHMDSEYVRNRVETMLISMLYRICLGSFSTLSLAVGTQKMDEIYDIVANKIGSPAAKLISFTIKSYYGPLKITELEELMYEFKDNPIAKHILKARTLKYIYNNTVSFKDKQRIGQICDMKLLNSAQILIEKKRNK